MVLSRIGSKKVKGEKKQNYCIAQKIDVQYSNATLFVSVGIPPVVAKAHTALLTANRKLSTKFNISFSCTASKVRLARRARPVHHTTCLLGRLLSLAPTKCSLILGVSA